MVLTASTLSYISNRAAIHLDKARTLKNELLQRLAIAALWLLIMAPIIYFVRPRSAEENTVFAPGWSEERFQLLSPGMPVRDVIDRLGRPLSMIVYFGRADGMPRTVIGPTITDIEISSTNNVGGVVLEYSACSRRFGKAFRVIAVTVEKGVLKHTRDDEFP